MGFPRKVVLLTLALLAALALFPAVAFAQEESEGEAAVGVITGQPDEEGGEDVPIEGVTITVTTPDGEEIGSATTDANGEWTVPLPGPGSYVATLDESTLPEDRSLRDPERATLEFDVRTGQQRRLLFPLGERGGGVTLLDRLPQLLAEGVKFGLIIAITAIGLSLIFGTTGITNFAHGELVTFGALAAWFFNASALGPRVHLIPSALLAIIAGGLVGAGMERGLFGPLRRRGTGLIALLVVSIGLSLLLRNLYLLVFGGRTRPYADYAIQRGLALGPVSITPKDLWVMVLSVIVLLAVGFLLVRTKAGKAMRAVADNADLARSSGIDVDRVILYVWVLGASLAALGGVFQGVSEQVSFQMGFLLLLLMFAAVTLGGLGTAFGAVAGGLVIGVAIQVSTLFIPTEIRYVTGLAILIVVLLVRPQGILGRAERVG